MQLTPNHTYNAGRPWDSYAFAATKSFNPAAKGLSALYAQAACGAAESAEDVLLELQVPFWIGADDVHVDIGEQQLHVSVRNTFCFSRTYWTSR